MKENNMNFITTNLNEKFLNVRKIYCLKLFIFFIKDPDPVPDLDPDLYVGSDKSRPDPQHWVKTLIVSTNYSIDIKQYRTTGDREQITNAVLGNLFYC